MPLPALWPLRRDVVTLALPILVEQLLVSLLGIVNTIMAARIGKEAVSAIGMIDALSNLVIALFSALAVGATVVVAQATGRGDHARARAASLQALASACLISLVVGCMAALCRRPILAGLYGSSDALVMDYMQAYWLITAASYPLMAFSLIACGALRGAGKTAIPMKANTLMNVLNVFFGYALIYGFQLHTAWFSIGLPGYGVAGAAWAISLARLAGAAYLLWALYAHQQLPRGGLRAFRFDAPLQRAIFAIGIPSSVESLAFQGGKLIVQVMVVGLGTVAIAANFIAFSISFLINIPGSALAVALTALVGQRIGRGDEAGAREAIHYVIVLATLCLITLGIVIMPLAPHLARLYSSDPAVVELTALLVRINGAFMLFFATTFVLPAGLKGAGDARYAMVTTLIGMCACRILLGWLLGIVLGWGIVGIWLGMFADWIARSLLYLVRLRGRAWLPLPVRR